MRDSGANVGFAPADFRRFISLLASIRPRVLAGTTVRQRREALAAIAHPDLRDGLLDAAARASGGRPPMP